MLSEIRKWKVSLTLAHQYLYQLDNEVKNSVLGNVGTIICFRLGQADAKYMASEFYPTFEASDFLSLENYDIYLKLMIYGKPSRPFSATTAKSHLHSDVTNVTSFFIFNFIHTTGKYENLTSAELLGSSEIHIHYKRPLYTSMKHIAKADEAI